MRDRDPRAKRRRRAFRLATTVAAPAALMLAISGTTPAFATPEEPSAPQSNTADPERIEGVEDGDWATSFEEDDPQPTWADLVDTDDDGKPRAEGVSGPDPSGIPGDISGHITEATASGENSGEGAAELVDGDINSSG